MFISRVQLQFYALKIPENCLFQLQWQHQQCKKIIAGDQIFLKALLHYIFCQAFLSAQTLSCHEVKWLTFVSAEQNDFEARHCSVFTLTFVYNLYQPGRWSASSSWARRKVNLCPCLRIWTVCSVFMWQNLALPGACKESLFLSHHSLF